MALAEAEVVFCLPWPFAVGTLSHLALDCSAGRHDRPNISRLLKVIFDQKESILYETFTPEIIVFVNDVKRVLSGNVTDLDMVFGDVSLGFFDCLWPFILH